MKKMSQLALSLVSVLAVTACINMGSERQSVSWAKVVPPKPAAAEGYSEFLVGRYASLTNDPQVAAERFASASLRDPSDPGILERAVFSMLLAGDVEGARNLVGRVSTQSQEMSSLTLLTLGVDHLRHGDSKRALDRLEGGEYGAFNAIVARGLSAWASLDQGDLDAAKAYLVGQPTGDDLLDGLNFYQLGLLLLAAGEDEAAFRTLEAVWENDIRLALGADAYARILAVRGDVDGAKQIIREFREDVGPNAALDELERTLNAGETVTVPRLNLQEGGALAVYAPAAALASQTSGDLAGVYFVLALALDENLHVARTMLADSLDRSGRHGEAMHVLSRIPESSAFYATAQAQSAWVLRGLERNDEALQTAEAALSSYPDRTLQVQLADLFRSLEQYEQSDELFSAVIDADADIGKEDWRLFYARGTVRERMDQWDIAEADLQKAMQLNPDQAQILNFLGYSWVDRGENLEEAFKLIQRAVDLQPEAGYIVDSLGWAHYMLGHYDEAVVHLERAVELAPQEPVLNDHLGDAYWQVGRKLEAHFQWERALSLNPDDALAESLHAKLDQGLSIPVQHADAQNTITPITP